MSASSTAAAEAQPARGRAFIELVVVRLVDKSDYVLNMKELRAAARGSRNVVP